MKHLKLFENIDFEKISKDIDTLDIEKQDEIVKKLKKFTFDKIKDVNKRKKDLKEEELYEKNKKDIKKINDILKNSVLRKIVKKYDLDNIDGFKLKRKYENQFRKKSFNVINNEIERIKISNSFIIDLDKINLKLYYDYYISIRIEIFQRINNNGKLSYKMHVYTYNTNNRLKDFEKKYSFYITGVEIETIYDFFEKLKKDIDLYNISAELTGVDYNL